MVCVILFGIACMGFVGYLLSAIMDEDMKKSAEYWEYLNDGYYPFISFERWKEKKMEKKK